MCQVGGITCNAEGFAGETGAVVDVLEGGERDMMGAGALALLSLQRK